ncbi:TRAP-type mannitol/chloroaromatic compound transport system, small permease component [Shimia gijangensis]|uniref:TRAP transporter small permease protein n=1 Tax=Shimia gijangensis TaxID=1470563 RepID=A0A1M6LPQ9_9RHOB|nr:TRAP transporter small permease [Shimia gijangensis]SHJ73186.1 TRAP-type mannitol/chloroaromatic compound transport system, small permease component [Shimia gijangensis]
MTDLSPELRPDEAGPAWFRQLRRGVDGVTVALNVAGTLLIFLVMLLVNFDVIGRNFFASPISGVPEMVSMSIVAIVFLQIAQTFRKGRLTRTEAVLGYLERRAPRLRVLLDLIFAAASALLIWQLFAASLPLFNKAWVRGTFEGTVGDFTAPVWPVKLIILIGCAALLVQLVLFAASALFRLIEGKGPES